MVRIHKLCTLETHVDTHEFEMLQCPADIGTIGGLTHGVYRDNTLYNRQTRCEAESLKQQLLLKLWRRRIGGIGKTSYEGRHLYCEPNNERTVK